MRFGKTLPDKNGALNGKKGPSLPFAFQFQ
jgi:hypothetical protein